MKTKSGIVADLRYQDDACVIHIDCGDGAHTATLPKDEVDKYDCRKGMKADATIDEDSKATGFD